MEKTAVIHEVSVSFKEEGTGQDVVLLHGWGQNKEMMDLIFEHLKDRFHVFSLDFPGFGESGNPPEAWGVLEYTHFLEDFIGFNHIQNPIFIGHSFGCRMAIRYAALHHDVKKMVLTGAAGIKPKRGADYYMRTAAYKTGKWFLKATGQKDKLEELQKNAGSQDYRSAQGIMKAVFVKVVNDDVTPVLKDVVCPVLLVWGDQDTAAPIWMGKVMEKEMKDAGLAVFEGDDHWAYWHQPARFNAVLDVFLKEDAKSV